MRHNGTWNQTLRDLHSLSTNQPGTRPSLIVWPESPAPFFLSDPRFRLELTAVAVEAQSYVIAGALGTTAPGKETETAGIKLNVYKLAEPAQGLAQQLPQAHFVNENLPLLLRRA